jgi:alanine-glyoxylate transaminase/serine-glyoxylate transaminase/serine-pyruvate transaminase
MLPERERLLLGPGPSPVSPRVMAALSRPMRSHLDPDLLAVLDDLRARLSRVLRAPEGSLVLAVSGTGTSAMEAAVANLVSPGARALAAVNGYFGDRLATMLERYGAVVTRVTAEWGRAIDPAEVARALADAGAIDLVTIVHAETSTGVLNPIRDVTAFAHAHDALIVVDAVTSLGALPFDMAAWDIDACYSCSQKGLGAPPGLSPIAFAPRARARMTPSRSFALDAALLDDFWTRRHYHHTISAPLVWALHTALTEVEEEGLAARWQRHERTHHRLLEALTPLGLGLWPAAGERLWNLNAVRVPDDVNEATVRAELLRGHDIEIGAGLGPLAGRAWRVGLMGSGATNESVDRLSRALPLALAAGRKRGVS